MYRQKRSERSLPDSVLEPLFAANNTSSLETVEWALGNKELFTIVQVAPAVRAALAEDFGYAFGAFTPGKMAAALKALGFDRVYDTNFFADLTIMEEASELIQRVKDGGLLPMFTSCCPAWVSYIETNHPTLTGHLSTCKSPQQMAGAVIKTYGAEINKVDAKKIFSVSIMPCTSKAYEAARKEMNSSGYQDVDVVLTTRELAYLIKDRSINFMTLDDAAFDSPLSAFSGAGEIFGATGGVMEAALRTGYELLTGTPIPNTDIEAVRHSEGFRKVEVIAGDVTLKAGVVTGLKNIEPLLEALEKGKTDLHFIEVMTCPSGCVSGGGQPKLLLDTEKEAAWSCRRNALYEDDTKTKVRKSHENPDIKNIYKDFLGEPLGEKSHHLLHTHYK